MAAAPGTLPSSSSTEGTNKQRWFEKFVLRGRDKYSGFVTNRDEADAVIKAYKEETDSRFKVVSVRSTAENKSKDLHKHRILWPKPKDKVHSGYEEETDSRSKVVPHCATQRNKAKDLHKHRIKLQEEPNIPKHPYIVVDSVHYECEHGPDRNKHKKNKKKMEKEQNGSTAKQKNNDQNMTCPAALTTREIQFFTEYTLDVSRRGKTKKGGDIKKELLSANDQPVMKRMFYIQLVEPSEHQNHPQVKDEGEAPIVDDEGDEVDYQSSSVQGEPMNDSNEKVNGAAARLSMRNDGTEFDSGSNSVQAQPVQDSNNQENGAPTMVSMDNERNQMDAGSNSVQEQPMNDSYGQEGGAASSLSSDGWQLEIDSEDQKDGAATVVCMDEEINQVDSGSSSAQEQPMNDSSEQAGDVPLSIDQRIRTEVKRLVVEERITCVRTVQALLEAFVEEEHLPSSTISTLSSTVYPNQKEVGELMHAAQTEIFTSDFDEKGFVSCLNEWKQSLPEDSFHFVPPGENSNFLFIHQSQFQKGLLTRYGNDVFVIERLYKSSIPLFVLLVKTSTEMHKDRLPIAIFVTQYDETTSIQAALSKLKEWNPDWRPTYAIVDLLEQAHMTVLSQLFPACSTFTSHYFLLDVLDIWEIETHEDVWGMVYGIARARTEKDMQDAINTLKNSYCWSHNKPLQELLSDTWLKQLEKWVWFHSPPRLESYFPFGERNYIFNSSCGVLWREERTFTGILTHFLHILLPDKYKTYIDHQIESLKYTKKYRPALPNFLHNYQKDFATYCMDESQYVGKISSIQKEVDGTFTVKDCKDGVYNVTLGDDDSPPSCTCGDQKDSCVLCRHMMAIFLQYPDSWNDLPEWYRCNPLFLIDETCLKKAGKEVQYEDPNADKLRFRAIDDMDNVNDNMSGLTDDMDSDDDTDAPDRNENRELILELCNELLMVKTLSHYSQTRRRLRDAIQAVRTVRKKMSAALHRDRPTKREDMKTTEQSEDDDSNGTSTGSEDYSPSEKKRKVVTTNDDHNFLWKPTSVDQ